jgi:hypothetical protein
VEGKGVGREVETGQERSESRTELGNGDYCEFARGRGHEKERGCGGGCRDEGQHVIKRPNWTEWRTRDRRERYMNR